MTPPSASASVTPCCGVAAWHAGETVSVPDAAHTHVFVALGSALLEGAGELAEGDAVRLTGAGSPLLTAGEAGAEVLIWATA